MTVKKEYTNEKKEAVAGGACRIWEAVACGEKYASVGGCGCVGVGVDVGVGVGVGVGVWESTE